MANSGNRHSKCVLVPLPFTRLLIHASSVTLDIFIHLRRNLMPTWVHRAHQRGGGKVERNGSDFFRLLCYSTTRFFWFHVRPHTHTHIHVRAHARVRTQKLSIKGIKSQTLLPHYDLYKPNSFRTNTIRLDKSITWFMRRSYQTYEKLSNRTRYSSQTISKDQIWLFLKKSSKKHRAQLVFTLEVACVHSKKRNTAPAIQDELARVSASAVLE